MISQIKPIDYNFYNLDREDRYDFVMFVFDFIFDNNYKSQLKFSKKSVEYIEFTSKHDVGALEQNYLIGPIMGTEKNIFGLHGSMVRNSIELWANDEQKKHWLPKIDNYTITMTYGIEIILIILF